MSEEDAAISMYLAELREAGRFAPRPRKWADFHDHLTRGHPRESWPALPLILAAHWSTTAAEKHERLAEHLRWAASHGRLHDTITYLRSLGPDDWSPLPIGQWDGEAGGL